MPSYTVSNASELIDAISVALDGDEILLASGDYGRVVFEDIRFGAPVTIRSANAEDPARFTSITFENSANLTINGVEVSGDEKSHSDLAMVFIQGGSDAISIENSEIYGLGAPAMAVEFGVLVDRATNISFHENFVHHVNTGFRLHNVRTAEVVGNHIESANPEVAKQRGLYLTEVAGLNLEGNTGMLGRHVWANGADNLLSGGPGDDLLRGRRGDDTLQGGPGDDTLRGEHDNDTLLGGVGDDYLFDQGGFNLLRGGHGDDSLYGGAWNWNETLDGGQGDDFLYGSHLLFGGAGDDTLFAHYYGAPKLDGGAGDDLLYGRLGADTLIGGAGQDTLIGGAGSRDGDMLIGGAGSDVFVLGARLDKPNLAADTIADFRRTKDKLDVARLGVERFIGEAEFSGDGAGEVRVIEATPPLPSRPNVSHIRLSIDANGDGVGDSEVLIRGYNRPDLIDETDFIFAPPEPTSDNAPEPDEQSFAPQFARSDRDIIGDDGDDALDGDARNDRIFGDLGADSLSGGEGDDILYGGAQNDFLFGDAGDDLLLGNAGSDRLFGRHGDDHLIGGNGADTLKANRGDDTLDGGRGDDWMLGGRGDDLMWGGLHNDTLHGQDGADTIYGGDGADLLTGGLINSDYSESDDDLISGGADNDTLFGSRGDDTLFGGADHDYLSGGDGDDVLVGGTGSDTMLGDAGRDLFVFDQVDSWEDVIRGFGQGDDMIDVSGIGVERFSHGAFTGDGVGEVRIAYSRLTSAGRETQLQFDVDGDGHWDSQVTVLGGIVNQTNFVFTEDDEGVLL